MDDVKLALLGNKEAAKRLTDAGAPAPCALRGKPDLMCTSPGTPAHRF